MALSRGYSKVMLKVLYTVVGSRIIAQHVVAAVVTEDPYRSLYRSAATCSCCAFGRVKLKVLPSPTLL